LKRKAGAFYRRPDADVSLPAGKGLDFDGTAQAQHQSKRDLLVHSLLVGLGIVLLLSIAIGNYRNVLLILLNLPFAMVGGLLAAYAVLVAGDVTGDSFYSSFAFMQDNVPGGFHARSPAALIFP
jgi:multidrug efflux pump subunit AcrB